MRVLFPPPNFTLSGMWGWRGRGVSWFAFVCSSWVVWEHTSKSVTNVLALVQNLCIGLVQRGSLLFSRIVELGKMFVWTVYFLIKHANLHDMWYAELNNYFILSNILKMILFHLSRTQCLHLERTKRNLQTWIHWRGSLAVRVAHSLAVSKGGWASSWGPFCWWSMLRQMFSWSSTLLCW